VKRKLSFVIPCYGSERTIAQVIQEIVSTVKQEDDYEIICVNDSSPDHVLEVLEELASALEQLKVISFTKNFGQHNALMAGYRQANGDIIISLDDDGQTPATECYKLIDALGDDLDVIFARYPEQKQSLYRRIGSSFASMMGQMMMGSPKELYGSSFFACKRLIVDEITRYENPYTFIAGLIFRSTDKLGNVDITHNERAYGKSGYSFKKLVSLWLNGFTSFSVKPLRVASVVGFAIAAIGFIFGVYTIINRLLHPDMAQGYSSLMAVILFIGGMLMVMLGLLGEYVGRIFISLNKAPQYVIRETVNINKEEELYG